MNDAPSSVRKSVEMDEILRILPHRYPLLLVDRVIEIDGVGATR